MTEQEQRQKTIGLIWGMSWESSQEYYRIINETIKNELWGLHSGKILMYSVDFDEVEKLQHKWDWESLTKMMIEIAQNLEKAGADFVLICTNTMHKMAEDVQKNISIPLLHLADTTAEVIKEKWIKKIWLLGTKFTMEQDFYKGRLEQKHDLEVVVPNEADRKIVHDVIYNELCLGDIKSESKKEYLRIIEDLVSQGAEWVILWCTEIPLLVQQKDTQTPLFDTTTIHAEKAAIESIK